MLKNAFVKTRNVKRFVGLMENLKKAPPNLPKMALVCGEHGLGKSQTIMWWVTNNDAVYVRANQAMTSRWLLSEIAEELGESPFWHTQETFTLIENHLRKNPKIIVVDEVDYLISHQNTVETLRDERLRDTLQNIKGRFLLSYDDSPKVRELYKDFNMIAIERLNGINNKSGAEGRKNKMFKELLIANYDIEKLHNVR